MTVSNLYVGHSVSANFAFFWQRMRKKYPEKIFEIDGVGVKQLDEKRFADKFFDVGITSDVSVDANANIDSHNVVSYSMEHKKPIEKLLSYEALFNELESMFDTKYANDVCEMQLSGDLYINDFHGFSLKMPYCFNYSTYDLALKGLSILHRPKCAPPKHLYAFKSQVEQFITIAANSTLGATSLADLLIVFSIYMDSILETQSDAHFNFASESDCWCYAKESLISLIYTLNQPMRGNQCVKEDTEVLTPSGFKKYTELSVGDPIYAWDDGKMVVSKIEKINVSDFSGFLHEYSGRDCIQTVTPEHRILRQRNNKPREFELVESKKLFDRKTPLCFPVATLINETPDYNISDDELTLLTMVLTDGSVDLEKGGRISIFKSVNRYGHELIKNTLEKLNLEFSIQDRPSEWSGIVKSYRVNTESSQKYIKMLNGHKKSLPDFFFKLSRRQANLVLDVWAKFDGFVEEDNYNKTKLQCDNYEIADQVQHLCFLAGKGSRKTERLIGSNKTATIYVVPYNRTVKYAEKKRKVQYTGKVWCPTTKQGVVVFREAGKVFISGNSPFSNISIYDKNFLESLLPDYASPITGDPPRVKTVQKMQRIYLECMNEEMSRSPMTFPVTTVCLSVPDKKLKDAIREILDKDFLWNVCSANKKFGFINFFAGDNSTLSSCCRLASDKDFLSLYSNSFGAGSSKVGSLGVVTINLPRLAIKYGNFRPGFLDKLEEMADICSNINQAKANIIKRAIDTGHHPLYTEGFIDLSRQYRTLGINGFYEAIEFCGFNPLDEDGLFFGTQILDRLNSRNNELSAEKRVAHNMEQVPGETLSVKLAAKDALLNYQSKFRIYSNQFIPLNLNVDLLERIRLQGYYDKHFTGGSIGHFNLEEIPKTVEEIVDFVETCVEAGSVYFALNYNLQECASHHIVAGKREKCQICGGKIINEYSRPVGFLANTKNFNQVRREEEYPSRQFYNGVDFSEHFSNSVLPETP